MPHIHIYRSHLRGVNLAVFKRLIHLLLRLLRGIVEGFINCSFSFVFLGRFLLTILGLISGFLILRFSSTRSNFSVSILSGSHFLLYLFGYGIGRFWIEGLRTDQLILFGTGLPVSQLLAAVMAVAAAAIILLGRKKAASVSSQETNKAEKSE